MAITPEATSGGQNSTNTTTHTVDLTGLGTQATDDLVLIVFSNDGGATASINAGTYPGWTVILMGGSANNALKGFWRRATGTDPSSIVVDLTASQYACWNLYRFSGVHTTQAPESGTPASSTGAAPDPPSVTASWGSDENAFIACEGHDGNPTTDSYPTNYSSGQLTQTNANNPHGVGVGSAVRITTAATDDPGTFGLSASTSWSSNTIVLRPAPAPTFSAAWAHNCNRLIQS